MTYQERIETPQHPTEPPVREIDALALVGPAGVVPIRLGEALYLLRITRQGKLLLTK